MAHQLRSAIIVTGANGGLGSAIAARIVGTPELASKYHGIFTVRKAETATTLNGILKGAPSPGHKHDVVALDLGRLASVRAAAADINKRVAEGSLPPIKAIVLNAAFQEWTTQTFSEDGFDMSFQASYLGHWLFVLLLLQSMDKARGRVVVIGSYTHE